MVVCESVVDIVKKGNKGNDWTLCRSHKYSLQSHEIQS